MAYTTINKSSEHFNTKLYTGNGSTNTIDNGFRSDFLWVKSRSTAVRHMVFDTLRGTESLSTDDSNQQYNRAGYGFTSLASNGFTMNGNDSGYNTNTNGVNYASWNWKANGASSSSNTDGDVTSTVSVNSTAGFSIVKWTNSGNAGWIGHGLGTTPHWILIKNLGSGSSINAWVNYHHKIDATEPEDYTIYMNNTDARSNNPVFNDTPPTSTKFRFDSGDTTDYIAYCFAEKQGFSKFGSYVGNGSTDGTFVYTGFKPAFVICKITNGVDNWILMDNKRLGYNGANYQLLPNSTVVDQTPERLDLLSNGFKCRNGNGEVNGSGSTYIYMAFAEAPLVGTNGVTAKAR
jgi:hypothetical protein